MRDNHSNVRYPKIGKFTDCIVLSLGHGLLQHGHRRPFTAFTAQPEQIVMHPHGLSRTRACLRASLYLGCLICEGLGAFLSLIPQTLQAEIIIC